VGGLESCPSEALEAHDGGPYYPGAATWWRLATLREDPEELEAVIVGSQNCLRDFAEIGGYRAAKFPSQVLSSSWACMMHYRICAIPHRHLHVCSFHKIA
jgi:hypothetical protein